MTKEAKPSNINMNLNLNLDDLRTPFILQGIAIGISNANIIFDKKFPPKQHRDANYALRTGEAPLTEGAQAGPATEKQPEIYDTYAEDEPVQEDK